MGEACQCLREGGFVDCVVVKVVEFSEACLCHGGYKPAIRGGEEDFVVVGRVVCDFERSGGYGV